MLYYFPVLDKTTQNSATKNDLKRLVSTIELKRVERNLRAEILRVEGKVENIEDSQKRVETKLDKLQNTLDGFVDRVSTLTEENQVGAHHTSQLRVKVDDHEKIIKHIESSRQISTP